MGPSEAEIEARLASLRRQREVLDREIADHMLYLELGRRLRGAGPVPENRTFESQAVEHRVSEHRAFEHRASGHPPAAPEPMPFRRAAPPPEPVAAEPPARMPVAFEVDPVGARRYGRALVEAACGILVRAGRPMHAGEILEALVAEGFTVPGQDPVAALNTRLWKRAGPHGPLRRLGDAVYAPASEPEPG